jgi:hypothetical protein
LGLDLADYGRVRLALVLILPALFAGRAATASNTMPVSPAGAGVAQVSGYTVSAVSYSLAGESVDGVSFTLSPAGAVTVKARLAPGEPWTPCTVVAGTASCPVSTNAAATTSLEVVAAS